MFKLVAFDKTVLSFVERVTNSDDRFVDSAVLKLVAELRATDSTVVVTVLSAEE